MKNVFKAGNGFVLSADIAVPEHDREFRFYSRVLTTGGRPLWQENLLNNLGLPIIGLGPASPDYANLPLQWMPHIQVADVAFSVERALALGGKELMHARDDDGISQWAVLLDPNGAAFGLVPVVAQEQLPSHDTTSSPGAIGRIAWLDLTVADAAATRDFYREVVGWSADEVEMEDAGEKYADYTMLGEDGHPTAGVCHARGVNAGLPPVWMLYLPVSDLAESLRRVEEEGGRIVKRVHTGDGKVMYAAVQDPVGVYFALVEE